MRRVISVTRRHIDFLFTHETEEIMHARTELVLDTELQLPTTDDSHVGEDTN